jgi:ABC-type transport system involved in cytochrome bd biosynthesis fused ATPase/permease subunit
MSKDENERRQNVPLWCRVLLRIPQLDLGVFGERFQGIFWMIILPVFLICDFFMNLLVLTWLSFPFNLALLLFANLLIVLFLLRILVDRALQAQEAILNQGRFRWDIEGSFKEYLSILNEKKTRKNPEKE